ncbi:hypothetical protein QE152_g22966 [Popillia japonica]|uniref:Uncharacterized protein n=1 Tax=Popillia japonica TaxID=7064 RepID=A0AAW1KH26_POPJA
MLKGFGRNQKLLSFKTPPNKKQKLLQPLGLQLPNPWMESRPSKKISGKLQSEIRAVLRLTHIPEEEPLGPGPKKLKSLRCYICDVIENAELYVICVPTMYVTNTVLIFGAIGFTK